MSHVLSVFLYACGPAVAMALGGTIAAFYSPGRKLSSCFQHFTAGVVFAALATEILPDVVHQKEPLAAILGFAAGTVLMLTIRWWTKGAEGGDEEETKSPLGLVATVGVDVLIDGLLIGIAFVAGAETGVLLTIALGMEVLFLGLSTSAAMAQGGWPRARLLGSIIGLALLLPLGASLGAGLLGGLQGAGLEFALSFGSAALLYLVTEELLVEAHEVPETNISTAMFFVGFLVLLIIAMMSRSPAPAAAIQAFASHLA